MLPVLCFAMTAIMGTFTACDSDDDETPKIVITPDETGTFVDGRDGNIYTWARYGSKQWLTENLRYLPSEGTVPDTVTKRFVYNDGSALRYFKSFGFLYNYEAAVASVPEGWRLPTQKDWQDLITYTKGNPATAINLQLGGYYLDNEYFQQLHSVDYYTWVYGYYWSADTDTDKLGNQFAFYLKFIYNNDGIISGSTTKANYLSVRLVKDV